MTLLLFCDSKGMVGDCNLFFLENFFEDEQQSQHKYSVAEIEIMIAESKARKKGIAHESLLILMNYAITNLHTTTFVAKIGEDNTPSIKLFQKLGFVQQGSANVFKEVSLLLNVDETFKNKLATEIQYITYTQYDQ